jgi:hypothetical protein
MSSVHIGPLGVAANRCVNFDVLHAHTDNAAQGSSATITQIVHFKEIGLQVRLSMSTN